jgi:hypothetical protein
MAPMALFALEKATGRSFGPPVYRGLAWINRNELGVDMRDPGQHLIWRCILPENSRGKYWEIASNLIRSKPEGTAPRGLKVLYEQRSYEYGWLLYAFSSKAEADPALSTQG